MNIIDLIILVVLILGALTGFIRGFFKQTVMFLGTILVVVLSFVLKNPLSLILYENLPFFEFGGLTSLNILLYECLAFIVCLAVLSMALAIVIKISGVIEMVLKLTVLLALPSKILGMIVGVIQHWIILYVVLFIVSMPVFKLPYLNESSYADVILTKTPVISNITNDVVKSFNEIAKFTATAINIKDIDNTNNNIIEIMLKNDVVKIDSIKLLCENKKIKLSNLNELIEKYKED